MDKNMNVHRNNFISFKMVYNICIIANIMHAFQFLSPNKLLFVFILFILKFPIIVSLKQRMMVWKAEPAFHFYP